MQSTAVMQYYGCVLLWFQMIHINAKGKKKNKRLYKQLVDNY